MWVSSVLTTPDPIAFPGYEAAVLLLIVAVLIEMTAEPLFIYAQSRSHLSLRVIAESVSLLVRCLLLLGFVLTQHWMRQQQQEALEEDAKGSRSETGGNGSHILLVFATGQVAGSCCYAAVFWSFFASRDDFDARSFLPSIRSVSSPFAPESEDERRGRGNERRKREKEERRDRRSTSAASIEGLFSFSCTLSPFASASRSLL